MSNSIKPSRSPSSKYRIKRFKRRFRTTTRLHVRVFSSTVLEVTQLFRISNSSSYSGSSSNLKCNFNMRLAACAPVARLSTDLELICSRLETFVAPTREYSYNRDSRYFGNVCVIATSIFHRLKSGPTTAKSYDSIYQELNVLQEVCS